MKILALLLAQAALADPACNFDSAKKIIAKTAWGYTADWAIADSPALTEAARPASAHYTRWVSWVRAHTKLTAVQILRNHIEVGERIIREMSPQDPFVAFVRAANAVTRKVIAGEVGRIRDMSCLESIPYVELLKVVGEARHAKEMNVQILRKPGQLRILADLYRDRQDGGATSTEALLRASAALQRSGWELYAHLHNHPFNFENPYGDIGGGTQPSAPDLDTYLKLRPKLSLVTNGIETIELRLEEIPQLSH